MKTVLLATDHTPPDPKALDYALVLSQRLAARLEVLNIVQAPTDDDGKKRLERSGIHPRNQAVKPDPGDKVPEKSHSAESDRQSDSANSHQLQRLNADTTAAHIDYRYEITGEPIDATIERYVRNHREIVLTVFVPRSNPQSDGISKDRPAKISAMPRLAIPLVLVKKTF